MRTIIVTLALLLSGDLLAQVPTRALGEGYRRFDTAASDVSARKIAAYGNSTVVLSVDGIAYGRGFNYNGIMEVPNMPGVRYVDVALGGEMVGLLSDGSLTRWQGWSGPQAAPQVPLGRSVASLSAGFSHSMALLSDGSILAWGSNLFGECSVPQLASGLSYVSMAAGGNFSLGVVSDGTLRFWGLGGPSGVGAIPTPPVGTAFTKVSVSDGHAAALRSDGCVIAWGSNLFGECNVPSLPAGAFYRDVVAGLNTTFAQLSNGTWIGWGDNTKGQCNIRPLPAGVTYLQIDGGTHVLGLRSDGKVEVWGRGASYEGVLPTVAKPGRFAGISSGVVHTLLLGDDGTITGCGNESASIGALVVPQLPPGVAYVQASAGWNFSVGLGSDGIARVWGAPSGYPSALVQPTVPAGTNYLSIDAGDSHVVAIRSDGAAVAWGNAFLGRTSIPPLPPGMSYISASAGVQDTVLIRSDGAIVTAGSSFLPPYNAPSLGPGVSHVQVDCGGSIVASLLSDGNVVVWGQNPIPTPLLPPGVVYVEVAAAGTYYAMARRSDGQIVLFFDWKFTIPQLPPHSGYLRIALSNGGNGPMWSAIVGAASRYVMFADGCSGSMPQCRLVPSDTPMIGRMMDVRLANLPANAALMVTGWSRLHPGVDLGVIGLPGCHWHVSADSAALISGSGGRATFTFSVPDSVFLLGAQFYQQALVLDGAANAGGAVVSTPAIATVGG